MKKTSDHNFSDFRVMVPGIECGHRQQANIIVKHSEFKVSVDCYVNGIDENDN